MARVMVPRQRFWPPNLVGYAGALGAALSLLRSKGGQLYMAGPANNEFIAGSGTAPDGVGTDPIGYVRNLAAEELGPELNPYAVPTPAMTGWATSNSAKTWDATEQAVLVTATAAVYPQTYCAGIPTTVGAVYELTLEMKRGVVANPADSIGGSYIFAGGPQTSIPGTLTADWQTTKARVVGTGATINISVIIGSNAATVGDTFYCRKISVREVRAASQTTTSAKPRLVREPILGPELVVNGDFSNGTTGWTTYNSTLSVSGGELTVAATSAGFPQAISRLFATVVGKTYQVVGTCRNGTATTPVAVRPSPSQGNNSTTTTSTSATQKTCQFTATGTTTSVLCITESAAAVVESTAVFDNISVREILGYRDVWSWEFDGVDDSLSASYEVPQAEGWLICAAVTKLAASTGRAVSMSNLSTSCEMFITCTTGGMQAAVITGSGTFRYGNIKTLALGETGIASAWLNDGKLITRINGVQYEAVTHGLTLSGSTTHVRINSTKNGGLVTHPARIQAPVITSGITTLAEVQQIERAVAQAAGVTLP